MPNQPTDHHLDLIISILHTLEPSLLKRIRETSPKAEKIDPMKLQELSEMTASLERAVGEADKNINKA